MKLMHIRLIQDNKFADFPIVKEKCLEFQSKFKSCTHCDAILIDVYAEEGDIEKAISICNGLITKDEIRKKYWEYRKNLLSSA